MIFIFLHFSVPKQLPAAEADINAGRADITRCPEDVSLIAIIDRYIIII